MWRLSYQQSFKSTKIIRWWSKSNSENGIWWTIKKLDANGNAIDAEKNQSMFVSDAEKNQSMFVLLILEKVKETRLKFS